MILCFWYGSVPTIFGTVINLSADSFVDQNIDSTTYEVGVSPGDGRSGYHVDAQHAAEVFIATGSRTLFQYLIKPFSNALARSLKKTSNANKG